MGESILFPSEKTCVKLGTMLIETVSSGELCTLKNHHNVNILYMTMITINRGRNKNQCTNKEIFEVQE